MKKYIPQFLKTPLIALYVAGKCLTRGGAGTGPILNLAGVLPPPGAIVHGGKVKLLALRERFGETWKHFNIAYFVSSGLPFAALIWIKIYKFFGIRVVWNQNGVAYPALYQPAITANINGLMSGIHEADYVFFQTEFTKKCADTFLGEYKGRSEILVNPIDTKKFAPGPAFPPEPFTIIMSGHHFESAERLRISLEAVRILRKRGIETKLLVIGNTQVLPHEDWVEAIGRFQQDEAPQLYQRAHVLLHLKYLDPCPTVVLEALATGLPVVGQANGGMPELVNEAAGELLAVPEDFENLHYPESEAVADALMKVRSRLGEYSAAARKQALRFDRDIWLKRHEEVFNELCPKSQ